MRLYFLFATIKHKIEEFKVTIHDELLLFLLIVGIYEVGLDHVHLYR
jgi:hypothetical protein